MIKTDIDLDFGSREELLSHIEYTPAILESGVKHNSGIYVISFPQRTQISFT